MNRRLLGVIGLSAFVVCTNQLWAQSKPAEVSLCEPKEVRYFGCRTAKGKLVSVCGQADGLTQYRFGRRGNIELRFPTDASGGSSLRYAYYMRYQTERYEVSFDASDTLYAVFDYTEGKRRSAGVRVTKPSGESVSIDCSGKVYSQLSRLESLLPCDRDNALNLGGCPGESGAN